MTGRGVLYAAFDAYPGLKGAQYHIRLSLRTLARMAAPVTLLSLGSGASFRDPESGADVLTCAANEPNFLRRSEIFSRFVSETADRLAAKPPAVVHFRDIWSGVPLLDHPICRKCRTVFEVNGLPSVELPDHFPRLAGNSTLLSKLRRLEEECLCRADRVIAVSHHSAGYLAHRGADRTKVHVIPNAAYPPLPHHHPATGVDCYDSAAAAGHRILLYAGTLAPWQGVETLLAAMTLLSHRSDLRLIIAAAGRKGTDRVNRLVHRQSLTGTVSIVSGVHHRVVPSLFAGAVLSFAPLSRGARNESQGCSPVKVVESMAAGTPVVASDLPAMRELVSHGMDGWLVPPGSPRALAAAIDRLTTDESLRRHLAQGAGERGLREFGPQLFTTRLGAIYHGLMEGMS